MSEPQYTLIRADGTRIPIPPTGVRLGRKADNDVVVNGSNISRYHARILIAAGKCWIRDENSALGTLLNGQLVPGQMEFKPGDTLHLGAEAFQLELAAPAAAAPPAASTPVHAGTPTRKLKPAVGIGLGIGLAVILLVAAFATGLFGGGGFGAGGVQYTRYTSPNEVVSIEHPVGWDVEADDYSVYLHDPAWSNEDGGVIILADPLYGAELLFGTDLLTPEDVVDLLLLSSDIFGLGEFAFSNDIRAATIGGDPAAVADSSFTDNGSDYHVLAAAVLSDDSFALFIGYLPESDWNANRSTFNHMLDSLRLE